MKKSFHWYYRPTEDEFSALWDNCLFVLDANVLLNPYRYTTETSEELISILDQISDRLWIPYQAAFEYHKRRPDVITEQEATYRKIQDLLSETQNNLKKNLEPFRRRHPFIDVDSLYERINSVFTEINNELNEREKEHPDLLFSDNIRDTITTLLEGKVGSPYPPERLEEIYKIGETRYKCETPPGYKDADKGGTRQYGDLVLWLQVIDKAKEVKKPIILITDDSKEDWWWEVRGKTIGPRPELISEMFDEAGVSFYMYQPDPFMEHAQEYLKRQVKQEAIDEVRDVRKHQAEYRRSALPIMPFQAWDEDTRKKLIEWTARNIKAYQTLSEQLAGSGGAFKQLTEEAIRAHKVWEELPVLKAMENIRMVTRMYKDKLDEVLKRPEMMANIANIVDILQRTSRQAGMLHASDKTIEDYTEYNDTSLDSEPEE